MALPPAALQPKSGLVTGGPSASHDTHHRQGRRDVAGQGLHRSHTIVIPDVLVNGPPRLMTGRNDLRRLAYFVALAYAISWGWTFPFAAAGDVVRTGAGWPTNSPAVADPAIAAVT